VAPCRCVSVTLLPSIAHPVKRLVIYNYPRYIYRMEMPKDPRGRKQHAPTDAQRRLVQLHASVGTPQDMIARLLEIDPKTLRLHYRDELDLSMANANATIAGKLFNKAQDGDTASMIFWLKTRAGWREKSDVNLISEDGSMSPTRTARDMTDDELAAMLDKP